jgi:hypothetical protein
MIARIGGRALDVGISERCNVFCASLTNVKPS